MDAIWLIAISITDYRGPFRWVSKTSLADQNDGSIRVDRGSGTPDKSIYLDAWAMN
jgi:hypothetical protein